MALAKSFFVHRRNCRTTIFIGIDVSPFHWSLGNFSGYELCSHEYGATYKEFYSCLVKFFLYDLAQKIDLFSCQSSSKFPVLTKYKLLMQHYYAKSVLSLYKTILMYLFRSSYYRLLSLHGSRIASLEALRWNFLLLWQPSLFRLICISHLLLKIYLFRRDIW